MSRHRILCIQKSNRFEIYNRIEFIGGLNPNGTRWRVSQSMAIDGIESGRWEFFVQHGEKIIEVIVSSNQGIKYLKTKSDDMQSNNLLSLPDCA
jgi:hypothetical protein